MSVELKQSVNVITSANDYFLMLGQKLIKFPNVIKILWQILLL